MKYPIVFFLFLKVLTIPAFGDVNIPASKVSLYQSATNDPTVASWYENGFDVGSYSKNYAMVTLAFFDLDSVAPELMTAGQIHLSVRLNSVQSTPRNMNIDYLGTFADMTNSLAKYSAPSLDTFPNVLNNDALPGLYSFDVTTISDDPLTHRYAVFRFYQTGYLIGDSTTREYHFSNVLADTRLITSMVPEPATTALLAAGLMSIAVCRRSR